MISISSRLFKQPLASATQQLHSNTCILQLDSRSGYQDQSVSKMLPLLTAAIAVAQRAFGTLHVQLPKIEREYDGNVLH